MNKAEIIRKISKKAGVPDTEAKKFFEMFLKSASDLLKPGESLKIPEIGLFQLRVGQIENKTNQQSGEQYIYSDLIVFINDKDSVAQEGEEIIFNVPSGIEEEYQPIDSYFSLSIGKPVIPLKGIRESEFFIPPSGTELRTLIESKIERILEQSEKVEGGRETETIHLKTEETGGEETDWKKLGVGNNAKEAEVPSRSDFLKTREFENLSWDFGENLSHEIEEESILDTEDDRDRLTPEAEDIEAVSKDASGGEDESEPVFEEDNENEEAPDENIFEEVIDDEEEYENIYEDFEEKVKEVEEDKQAEEIKAEDTSVQGFIISEEQHKVEEVPPLPEEIKEEKEEKSYKEPEEPSLKNFQRVRSLTKEFNSTEFDETKEMEESKPRKITEVRGGYQKVRRTTAEFDFDLSNIKGLDEIDEPPEKESPVSTRSYEGYRKRSYLPSLIIAFAVVIAMAVVIFFYMEMKSSNNESAAENKADVTKQETKVIDRDYDVPVTYPYDKAGQKSTADSLKGTKPPENKEKSSANEVQQPVKKTSEDLSVIREPVNAKRIGSYVYQYPDGVVVQVSSWKSRSIAVNEVDKYRKAGFTAFAEKATIPDRGLYYRVRVGYFKSLKEAENFLNGNY